MKISWGLAAAFAVSMVGCDSHLTVMLDGSTASDGGTTTRDSGPFMFRDAGTQTCAPLGESCVAQVCCGNLTCHVPANGGSAVCVDFGRDGGMEDATVVPDASLDASPDASPDAGPDAATLAESDVRLVVLVGEGDPVTLSCDDDDAAEAVATPPGGSPAGRVTAGERSCNLRVADLFDLATDLPLSVPSESGAFTLVHTGREGYAWVTEETTGTPGVYFGHFINFYSGSNVTFYDSTLSSRAGTRVGDENVPFGGVTYGGWQLDTFGPNDFYFGVDLEGDDVPEMWFFLERSTLAASTDSAVVNLIFSDDGGGPDEARMWAQLPSGSLVELTKLLRDTLSFRFATFLGNATTTPFGGEDLAITCDGPSGTVEIVRFERGVNAVPTDFSEFYGWPNTCVARRVGTGEVVGPFPIGSTPLPIDMTIAAFLGPATTEQQTAMFPVPSVEAGRVSLRFVNFSVSDSYPSEITSIFGDVDDFGVLDGPFDVGASAAFNLSVDSPLTTIWVNWGAWVGQYSVTDLFRTSGEYLIYAVPGPESAMGAYRLVVQPPPDSGENAVTLEPLVFSND